MVNVNRKTIQISDIDNFIDNPRTETAKNSLDQIKKLYGETSTSRKQLINLARSIAEKGYDSTEAIIVVSENNKYISYDGNRRLAALKLLLNYDNFDFLADSDRRTLEKLSKNGLIPNLVEVVVKSKNDALDYMQRVHGGQQEGVGHVDWNAENKRRFSERRGGYVLTNELNKGFEKEFGTHITDVLPVTTIDRILGNKYIKKKIGLNKDQTIFSRTQLEQVRDILQKADQISKKEGKAATRIFATSKDIEKKLLDSTVPESQTNNEPRTIPGKTTKVIKKELFTLTSNLPTKHSNLNISLVRNLMTVLN